MRCILSEEKKLVIGDMFFSKFWQTHFEIVGFESSGMMIVRIVSYFEFEKWMREMEKEIDEQKAIKNRLL